jgi:hypothetical protein
MNHLKLNYRHNRNHEPHFISNQEIREHAAEIRQQMNLGERRGITLDDFKRIERLSVNRVDYDLWTDFEHPVRGDDGSPVLGVFEYSPESCADSVSISVAPPETDSSGFLVLSTFAHELGHAVYDGPALIVRHQNPPLLGLDAGGTAARAFRTVVDSQDHLGKVAQSMPKHIQFAENRANEFMGALLVPKDLLMEAILEEAPKHALEVKYGEEHLFAESLDGPAKIMWCEATYDMSLWSITRAVAPQFGVSPLFIEVRMLKYGIIPGEGRPN